MKFNYKNSGISEHELAKEGKKLASVISEMKTIAERNDYSDCFASINLPFDSEISQDIKDLAEQYKNINYILVIGIGGSNLGTVAVYEAVLGKLYNLKGNFPEILFADAADPDYISDIKNIIRKCLEREENVLINCVSKSGTTTETAANFEIFLDIIKKYKKNYNDYVVVTTDEGSKLWSLAKKNKFKILKIPQKVGGRFSVFSAVGLFPLIIAGIDTVQLLKGARCMRNKCLDPDIYKNPAAISAIITYLQYKRNKNIIVNFFFSSDLESTGKWLGQLTAESIGKEKNLKGEVVNAGMTPAVATAVDLHSMSQLYLAGPPDKFTNFMRLENNENDIVIPAGKFAGKTLSEITNAIIHGVQEAYIKRKIPFNEIVLENKSEKCLGEFLQFKMMETIFLGHLLEINPFDQPNVEEYKVGTRRILEGE